MAMTFDEWFRTKSPAYLEFHNIGNILKDYLLDKPVPLNVTQESPNWQVTDYHYIDINSYNNTNGVDIEFSEAVKELAKDIISHCRTLEGYQLVQVTSPETDTVCYFILDRATNKKAMERYLNQMQALTLIS